MVGVETTDPASGARKLALEPQKRPMTVEDLLRHTAGLVYGVDGTMVSRLYQGLYGPNGVYRRDKTLADFVAGLAKLPLAHQPGEVWDYGISVDVLSRVVEVASGQPFDQFLETRLFGPLNMVDTGFYVPPAKLSRFVDPPAGPAGGRIGPPDSVLADVTTPTRLFAGGGGLVSTASDYLRFGQMLLNGGELDGVRILSPATVQADDHECTAVRHPLRRLCQRPRRAAGRHDLGTWLCHSQRCGVEHRAWIGWQL